MKILIVDDMYEKSKIVARGATRTGVDITNIITETNVASALKRLSENEFDIMFIDMQLPEQIGDDIKENGGIQLIEQLRFNKTLHHPTHIVAITSHKDAYDTHKGYFTEKGWVLLYEDFSEETIEQIISSRVNLLKTEYRYDYAIIVALQHTELEAVIELPWAWEKLKIKNDPTIYHESTFTNNLGQIKKIIACSCPRMGMIASSAITQKVCRQFNPSVIIMCGITAGIEGKVQIGDILVADPAWDWGCGKLTVREGKAKLLYSPHQVPLDNTFRGLLLTNSTDRKYLSDIFRNTPEGINRPTSSPTLVIGPIASGAVVLEDPETVSYIKEQNRNTIGVEMEGYGVMASALYSSENPPKTIIIKSVCDFANPDKNDDWQRYAAYASAAYTYNLIMDDFR